MNGCDPICIIPELVPILVSILDVQLQGVCELAFTSYSRRTSSDCDSSFVIVPNVNEHVHENNTCCVFCQRKLSKYEDEDWLSGEVKEEVEEGVDAGKPSHSRVRKSVLRDLGQKGSGDEMDTIARYVPHGYYLRSLDQSEYQTPLPPSSQGTRATPLPTYPHLSKPHLPAPLIPKGNSANDFYEALDAKDQEIRKGEVKIMVKCIVQMLVCLTVLF